MSRAGTVLVLDNYDSFTWNLVQSLEAQAAACVVWRSDAVSMAQVAELGPTHIVLSPGPFGPERTGICRDVVRQLGEIPMLGICLGMQVIAEVAGSEVVPSGRPAHGVARSVEHDGTGVLRGLPSPLEVGLYHSLVVDPASTGAELLVTAHGADGTIMGCRLAGRSTEGLLFHPESFLTPLGDRILANFLDREHVV